MRVLKGLMFCIVSVLVVLLAGCSTATLVPSPGAPSTAVDEMPDEVVVDKEQAAQIVLDTVVSEAHRTMDAQQGLRANQYGELLPAGSTIRPALPGEEHAQMLTCDNACWLFLIDKAPLAHFAHPVEIATVDSVTGEVRRIDAEWWPEVNDSPVFDTLESRSDSSQTIYYTPPHGEELDHDIPDEMDVIVQGACPVTDSCETWAILVCGYDDLPDTFDEDTDGMYSVLQDLGVPDDHVFFVSPHTGHAGVDRTTSLANVEWAIDQVADHADASDTVLFLYSSHGGIDSLSCVPGSAGGGNLGAAQLDGWLDGINSASLSIVIEACHSGSLIGRHSDGTYVAAEDDLTGEGETNRIVFTSASSDTSSYPDLDGADDPNPGDAGSETIWGYVEAFITASADMDNDAHMSIDEAHQYAWDNDVSRIRGMNTPQFTSTGVAEADTYNYCQCEGLSAENLLENPDASLGSVNWVAYGEAFVDDSISPNPYFAVRNKGYFLQDVAIGPEAVGQYALLIARVSSERINASGSITGLPYLYGYMMDGNHINAYLQGQNMRCNATEVDEWVAAWGIFEIPPSTSTIRFFLNQAERSGDPQNGSVARFDDVGLYIAGDEASARQLVTEFEDIFLR